MGSKIYFFDDNNVLHNATKSCDCCSDELYSIKQLRKFISRYDVEMSGLCPVVCEKCGDSVLRSMLRDLQMDWKAVKVEHFYKDLIDMAEKQNISASYEPCSNYIVKLKTISEVWYVTNVHVKGKTFNEFEVTLLHGNAKHMSSKGYDAMDVHVQWTKIATIDYILSYVKGHQRDKYGIQ